MKSDKTPQAVCIDGHYAVRIRATRKDGTPISEWAASEADVVKNHITVIPVMMYVLNDQNFDPGDYWMEVEGLTMKMPLVVQGLDIEEHAPEGETKAQRRKRLKHSHETETHEVTTS